MKKHIALKLALAACASLALGLPGLAAAHSQAPAHDHNHAKDCGHKEVEHGTHKDFLHDGHYHAPHAGHYDEHGMATTAMNAGGRGVASDHATHKDHKHKHADKCGHKAVKHDDHTDYDHDGHMHSAHGDHVDEHGDAAKK